MALACGPEGLWAGGIGGVAWRPTGGVWEPRLSGLPLTTVAALTYADGWLLAGGAEGIARSDDGGLTWQLGQSESTAQVSAIVASIPCNGNVAWCAGHNSCLHFGLCITDAAQPLWS
jgi:hypothetical protein